MSNYFELGPMTEAENSMAVEAHIRALNILHDAQNKKRWLLAEPGRDYGPQAANVPLICPQLIEDLIKTLQQVKLLKNNSRKDKADIGAIYPAQNAPVIALRQEFYQRHENLRFFSRPGALIMGAAFILGYYDSDGSRLMAKKTKAHQRPVLGASRICQAFEIWMGHKGKYVNGCYTCCGEKSEHSICEDSDMRSYLHCSMNEEQEKLAESSRKATLKILNDARNKELIVHNTRLINVQQSMVMCPLITATLLEDLKKKLEKVTLKCDNNPRNEVLSAYPGDQAQGVIYLCPFFWKQSVHLRSGSRLGTLILCASQMLGYSHVLDGRSNSKKPREHQEWDFLTADSICAAFECWMMHRQPYTKGSYSCCGENNEYSVCRESIMGFVLRQDLPLVTRIIDGNGNKDPVGSHSMANEDAIEYRDIDKLGYRIYKMPE